LFTVSLCFVSPYATSRLETCRGIFSDLYVYCPKTREDILKFLKRITKK
jgi:hypothetical protein